MREREPLLVRLGLRYFRVLSSAGASAGPNAEPADAVHVLNRQERDALRRIERGAILRAAIAGALSTVVSAAVEVQLTGAGDSGDSLRFYAVVGLATAICSVVEILYLYWDGLRAVHRLSREAGLDLFPDQDDDEAVAAAMARAALELPNPTMQLFGVDPRREASRLRLFVASIVYKLKVSVSNFLVKALVRRALGRAFVRAWLPFVAVPVTAAWNAVVCWLIMREARVRAMGPSAAREMVEIAFGALDGPLSPAGQTCVLSAVASSIVRTESLHPNLAALFREVVDRVNTAARPTDRLLASDGRPLDDTRAFLARLASLDPRERPTVIRVVSIAAIIDGRLTRAERRLLIEARTACGLPADLGPIERLRRAFTAGDPIEPASVRDLA